MRIHTQHHAPTPHRLAPTKLTLQKHVCSSPEQLQRWRHGVRMTATESVAAPVGTQLMQCRCAGCMHRRSCRSARFRAEV
jgi:hypothetical protein